MLPKCRKEESEGWRGEGAGAGMWVIGCSPVPDKAECGAGGQATGQPRGRERELQGPGRFPPPAYHLPFANLANMSKAFVPDCEGRG